MTEETTNQPTTDTDVSIVSHEFSGDICKVLVQGPTTASLTNPATKKTVYEYRHKIGASHMGLNKFEPAYTDTQSTTDGPICRGYWYLMAGL